jgi:hypothetical protein
MSGEFVSGGLLVLRALGSLMNRAAASNRQTV